MLADMKREPIAGKRKEDGSMKKHAQILVPPFHDASRYIQRFGARIGCSKQPWQPVVPVDELIIQIASIIRG